ncbi:unnamed protein product [Mycena citricolor]|uniref:Uncharacterized protein n=1 Tax=Mycena citricolor TaxID=2018698 RepID=A0AAD2GZU3_9AGAR|nr:unnamed protein product [Mycena citricolor]
MKSLQPQDLTTAPRRSRISCLERFEAYGLIEHGPMKCAVCCGNERACVSGALGRTSTKAHPGTLDHTLRVRDMKTGRYMHALTEHTSLTGVLRSSPRHFR